MKYSIKLPTDFPDPFEVDRAPLFPRKNSRIYVDVIRNMIRTRACFIKHNQSIIGKNEVEFPFSMWSFYLNKICALLCKENAFTVEIKSSKVVLPNSSQGIKIELRNKTINESVIGILLLSHCFLQSGGMEWTSRFWMMSGYLPTINIREDGKYLECETNEFSYLVCQV